MCKSLRERFTCVLLLFFRTLLTTCGIDALSPHSGQAIASSGCLLFPVLFYSLLDGFLINSNCHGRARWHAKARLLTNWRFKAPKIYRSSPSLLVAPKINSTINTLAQHRTLIDLQVANLSLPMMLLSCVADLSDQSSMHR